VTAFYVKKEKKVKPLGKPLDKIEQLGGGERGEEMKLSQKDGRLNNH